MAQRAQARAGLVASRYQWRAEETPGQNPWRRVKHHWRRVLHHARLVASAAYPSWFAADMVCIGVHEEGGSNSVAGYYGFIYSPSSYGGVAATLARTYGESWLDWPRSAQLEVAYMLYRSYGWSPWTTAAECGL